MLCSARNSLRNIPLKCVICKRQITKYMYATVQQLKTKFKKANLGLNSQQVYHIRGKELFHILDTFFNSADRKCKQAHQTSFKQYWGHKLYKKATRCRIIEWQVMKYSWNKTPIMGVHWSAGLLDNLSCWLCRDYVLAYHEDVLGALWCVPSPLLDKSKGSMCGRLKLSPNF